MNVLVCVVSNAFPYPLLLDRLFYVLSTVAIAYINV